LPPLTTRETVLMATLARSATAWMVGLLGALLAAARAAAAGRSEVERAAAPGRGSVAQRRRAVPASERGRRDAVDIASR
jgi:hypothetical protein